MVRGGGGNGSYLCCGRLLVQLVVRSGVLVPASYGEVSREVTDMVLRWY